MSMGGFIIKIGKSALYNESKSLNNFRDTLVWKKRIICNGVEVFKFDDDAFNYQYSNDTSISHLIIIGYITELGQPQTFNCQLKACNLLKSCLDECNSNNAIRELIDKINGSFSLVYIKKEERKVYTITDRVLSRPIWYINKGSEKYIASHILPIAAHSREHSLRPEHIASIMLYGAPINPQKSIFRGIHCQGPGSIYEHDIDGLLITKKTYWYRLSYMPDVSRPLNSWVEIVAERLVASARKILSTTMNPLLFLSGGVDSRITGAALVAAGGRPLCCTLGDGNNLEMKIATLVAKSLKCEHKPIIRDEEWYLRDIKRGMISSNGSFSWAHSHFSQAYVLLKKSHGADAALIGDFCEAFSKMCFTVPKERTLAWDENEFANEFDSLPLPNYRSVNRQKTLRLLNKDVRKTAEEEMDKNIRERYAEIRGISNDPLILGDLFFRWHMAPSIATFQMFNDIRTAGPERNIMFDKDVHQLIEIIPAGIRNQCNLGAKVVNELNAKAALIPNSNSLLPLTMPLATHEFAKKAKPVLGKIRRRLFSNTYRTTASWPHLPLLYSANLKWRDSISYMLEESGALPSEIFDQKEIKACWHSFCQGDLSRHADIERLFGFAHFFEILKTI